MKKKLVLMISIVILILVASLVSSVAFFSGLINGEKVISVKTGDLTFKYTEVSGIGNGINLIDTEPISDSEGKKLDSYFDFKIDANLISSDMIYKVSIESTSDTTINLEGIKVYITEIVNNKEKEINSNYDGLGKVKTLTDYNDNVIYQERIFKNTKNYEKKFRVRIWIDEDVDIYDDVYIGTKGGFRVNVNAFSNYTLVDSTIPIPSITGGSGTTWTKDIKTITLVDSNPILGGVKYEYYVTDNENDIPNDLTIATDVTDDIYEVNRLGKNYVYYRTVSSDNKKSAWSTPQIVYFDDTVYTITYNLNGGLQQANTRLSYDVETETFTLPTTPTKTGYTFNGWYDNSSLSGTAITQISKGSRGNKIYYAKWVANNYLVTLDKQSGSGGTNSVTATYDSTMPSITVPTRTGYTFEGYYSELSSTPMIPTIKFFSDSSTSRMYLYWSGIVAGNGWEMNNNDIGKHIVGKFSVTDSSLTKQPTLEFNDSEIVPTNVEKSGNTWTFYIDFNLDKIAYINTYRFIDINGVSSSSSVNVDYLTLINGTKYYNSDGSSSHVYNKPSDITLYAYWEKGYAITNLVTNGSFENDFIETGSASDAYWGNRGSNVNYYSVSSPVRYGSKSFRVQQISGGQAWPRATFFNKGNNLANHKIYMKVSTYRDNINVSPGIVMEFSKTADYWPQTSNAASNHTYNWNDSANWREMSIYTTAQYNYLIVMFAQTNDTAIGNIYFDGLVVVDLTATFGSGNEPDQAWCDQNISYFDSSTKVYK